MLRLTVCKDEYLMVGQDVRITFLGGSEKKIRLMIDAPREVNVARGKAVTKRAAERMETPGAALPSENGS